jgi:hypothetical protein
MKLPKLGLQKLPDGEKSRAVGRLRLLLLANILFCSAMVYKSLPQKPQSSSTDQALEAEHKALAE